MTNLQRLIRLIKLLINQEITLRQAYLMVRQKLFHKQRHLNDDFDWTSYHMHYEEEIKVIERSHTLVVKQGQFMCKGEELIATSAATLPMHPNHQLVYETVLSLKPESAREIGCGGGDHLHNLSVFLPNMALHGVDRSEEQLKFFAKRHPQLFERLGANLQVQDMTAGKIAMPLVDLSYTQAVLMHISETQDRFQIALRNMMLNTRSHLVLMENWAEHDFLTHVQSAMNDIPDWKDAIIYFSKHRTQLGTRAMIVSKHKLAFEPLRDYDELLQGLPMAVH
jgi:Methyltransferase domain